MKALRDKNADLADLEKILNPTDVKSSVMPRWQRKALQRSDSSTSNDRFIPTRRGNNLQDSFALLPDSQPKKRDAPQEGGKDDNLDTYTMLLRSEFLGSESHGGARRADDLTPTSPQRNLFRYKALPATRDENVAMSSLLQLVHGAFRAVQKSACCCPAPTAITFFPVAGAPMVPSDPAVGPPLLPAATSTTKS